MIRIPVRLQERPESCVPACLRMIFAAHGIERTEADIAHCCQTDIDGTLTSLAVRCAQEAGFEAVAQRLKDIDSLQAQLSESSYIPIVFLNIGPLLAINVIHAVVVQSLDIQAQTIHVIDPAFPKGHRSWAIGLFERGWQLATYQTVLVGPRFSDR